MQHYNIILADPPWTYKDKCNSGKRGASHKYPVINLNEIKALKVSELAADDSILFLWVTMPLLQEGLDTIKAWGFKYKTCAFTWVKRDKIADTWFRGTGHYTRANSELCLLATKGKPKRVSANVRSVIDTHREAHSKKPDIVREKIVELMGDLPRIELFGRQPVDGWVVLGNDIDGKDIRDSIEELI